MSPLKHSKSFAARMGRWSASHWKTAVIGWLAFVAAFRGFVGMQVGTKQINQTDANVGESRTADRIISDAGFAVDKNGKSTDEQGEMVLMQSKTLTAKDPAFRVVIADAVNAVQVVPAGQQRFVSPLASGPFRPDLEGRPLGADPVHPDRAVTTRSSGTSTRSSPRSTRSRRATRASTSSRPASRPTRRSTRRSRADSRKAGLISIPLTIIILMVVLGSLVAALIPLLVALSAIAATTGLLALSSQAHPGRRQHHGGDPADRARRRSRLLALLHAA